MKRMGVIFISLLILSVNNGCDFGLSDPEKKDSVIAPTGVSASDGTYADTINVSWKAVNGAGSYNVYFYDAGSGTATFIKSVSTTSSDLGSSDGVTTYKTYYFVVTAVSSTGKESTYSDYDSGHFTRGTLKMNNYSGYSITVVYHVTGATMPGSYGSTNMVAQPLISGNTYYLWFAPDNYLNFYIELSSYDAVSKDSILGWYPSETFYFTGGATKTITFTTGPNYTWYGYDAK